MQQLQKTDFVWHNDQPDVPGMTAQEMKDFLDAPIKTLMEKINEILGGDSAKNLEQLAAEVAEKLNAAEANLRFRGLEDAHNEQNVLIKNLADQTEEALAKKLDAAEANERFWELQEGLNTKASGEEVRDGISYLETRLNEERLLPLESAVEEIKTEQQDQEQDLQRLSQSKQDVLHPGTGISIVNNVISASANIGFKEVQDTATSDLPDGFSRFIDPEDESRSEFYLYRMGDNGYGGIEPTGYLPVEAGSICIKSKLSYGYLIVVFRNREEGGGYIIHNAGWEDSMTEMTFSDYVKNTDIATYTKDGLVRPSTWNGIIALNVGKDGAIGLADVRNEHIDARELNTDQRIPLLLRNLDYAVKAVLTDCKLTWTEEEKAAARALLGIE